ncbi:Fused nickel transport protein NikMN [Caloramator mitchellensis]|uniref:Fused nickel transport protein NikMN n=1 Tax=Caloramator mitchellensis TaxID=908809 RepID=A0A0R3JXQ4_CALMK|nr:energy-coupling factor ABC transporter permease [Caloramator mitchellensis]KRQ87850.1 Fused nickel transport protein NikMN [Caloramator mitchellensis]
MHMSDALISVTVGGTMLAATFGITAKSIKKIKDVSDESKVPLMGVMGAFVFAAQMINFTIPGTGSSGHLGGGLLLSILLGPYAGFVTMASILLIQAMFFGDGGLLAYGCNVFNLGFYTCFIAYPYVYKKLINKNYSKKNIIITSLVAAIVGLQLGAFSVVVETLLSGKTELPFSTFLMLMQPIHLAIGVVEGLVTAAVVIFIHEVEPGLIQIDVEKIEKKNNFKKVLVGLFLIAALIGGILSWYASEYPDGLEWSISKVTGQEELESKGKIHELIGNLQEKTAILPDYSFKTQSENIENEKLGTSFSGIVGSIFTVAFIVAIGYLTKIFRNKQKFKHEVR